MRYFSLVFLPKPREGRATELYARFENAPLTEFLSSLVSLNNWSQILRDPYFVEKFRAQTLRQISVSKTRIADWFPNLTPKEAKSISEMQAAIDSTTHFQPESFNERLTKIRHLLVQNCNAVSFHSIISQRPYSSRLNPQLNGLGIYDPSLTDIIIALSKIKAEDLSKGMSKVEDYAWDALQAYFNRLANSDENTISDLRNLMIKPEAISETTLNSLHDLIHQAAPMNLDDLPTINKHRRASKRKTVTDQF